MNDVCPDARAALAHKPCSTTSSRIQAATGEIEEVPSVNCPNQDRAALGLAGEAIVVAKAHMRPEMVNAMEDDHEVRSYSGLCRSAFPRLVSGHDLSRAETGRVLLYLAAAGRSRARSAERKKQVRLLVFALAECQPECRVLLFSASSSFSMAERASRFFRG